MCSPLSCRPHLLLLNKILWAESSDFNRINISPHKFFYWDQTSHVYVMLTNRTLLGLKVLPRLHTSLLTMCVFCFIFAEFANSSPMWPQLRHYTKSKQFSGRFQHRNRLKSCQCQLVICLFTLKVNVVHKQS